MTKTSIDNAELSAYNLRGYLDEINEAFLNYSPTSSGWVQPIEGISVFFVYTNQFRNSSKMKKMMVINPKRCGDFMTFFDGNFQKRYLYKMKYPLSHLPYIEVKIIDGFNPIYASFRGEIDWNYDVRES